MKREAYPNLSHLGPPQQSTHKYSCEDMDDCAEKSDEDKRWKITNKKFAKEYTIDKLLGVGGQGEALLLKPKVGKTKVVGKIYKKKKYADREATMLEIISPHERIVEFLSVIPNAPAMNETMILLGFCENGTLATIKRRHFKKERAVSEAFIWKVMVQLTEALAYLHWGYNTPEYNPKDPYGRQYSIVHRDIKPHNILCTQNPSSMYVDIKLADFGMAACVKKEEFYEAKTGGSEYWQPTEQVQAPNWAGPAQDIWALGAVIHYFALGEPPCDSNNGNDTLEGYEWRMSLPRRAIPINIPPEKRWSQWGNTTKSTDFSISNATKPWGGTYSDVLNHYMHRCLGMNPRTRITSIELLLSMGATYDLLMEQSGGNPVAFGNRVRRLKAPGGK